MALPLAGQIIRAADFTQYVPRYVQKAASQSVTSSTTLVDDNDFQFALAADMTYRVQVVYHVVGVSSATLGGFKGAWTNSGTMSSLGRSTVGPAFGSTSQPNSVLVRSTGHGATTAIEWGVNTQTAKIHDEILISVTAAGTLKYQWAQFASSATPTTASTASRAFITPIEVF